MYRRSRCCQTASAVRAVAATSLFLFGTAPANAHAPVPGIEGFYVGLLDPFSAVPQIALLTGLGFLIGGFETRRVSWLLPAFLLASLVGIVLGAGIPRIELALLGTAVLCGAVAAIAPGGYWILAILVASAAGVLIGAASIPDPGPMGARLITVLGSFVGANVGLFYIACGIQLVREKYLGRWAAPLFRSASALACITAAVLLALRLGSGV